MSTTPHAFRGPMPILPTPITPDGKIDETSLRRLVRYCLANGAAAIGHFGIASEFFKLDDESRELNARVVIEEVDGRVPVFLGATGASDSLAVKYARQAHALGADMLMVAIPYVNVPDTSAMCDYYRRVADATPLPIILQDTPTSAPMLTAEVACRLFDEVPTVQYIKAEGNDFISKTARVMEISGGRMPVIGGYGGKFMLHMLRLGVTSFMTGTEALDLHNTIIQAFLAGDQETAAKLYCERLLPYFAFYEMHPEQLLKQMLHQRGVIDHPNIIPPRASRPMSEIEEREFQWVLKRTGLDKPPPMF
ncbi:MAG: dihydrodipicolinate synthase family protein [Phycisphaerales bacterium]